MKKVIVWVMVFALAVSGGAYMGLRTPAAIVTATAIPDFDDSLSTAYETGSETTIQYEMDEENEKYDINVLYRFTATADYRYRIHVGGIVDDQDTYVNVSVIDADLNEYASFSTCGWDPENETVSYQTTADFQVELLGGRTYYVMLTSMSHEYKGAYAGTYDFCMAEEGEMNTGTISEEEVSVQVSADQTVYKKVRVEQSGWYELGIRREEESETGEDGIWMDVYDAEGNPVAVNEGKCYLEEGTEYDVLIRMAEDAPGATETVYLNIQNVKAATVSKETECTWVNSTSCEFTAEETEQVIIYSHSVSADPRITVLRDGEEITGNEDYPWGGTENEKDFGVVCPVEKGQTYTFLMDDHEKSGDKVKVYVETWRDPDAPETPAPSTTDEPSTPGSAEPTPEPSEKPSPEPDTVPTRKPGVSPSVTPEATAKPGIKPTLKPSVKPSPKPDKEPTEKPGISPAVTPEATAEPGIVPSAKPTPVPDRKPISTSEAVAPLPQVSLAPTIAPVSQLPTSPATADIGKIPSIKLKQKKQAVTVSWKKVAGAYGYQICYSTSKKWKNRKQKLTRKTKLTIKKLKTKKTYYFRVRAYRMNGTKKEYGAWSKTGKITIKK